MQKHRLFYMIPIKNKFASFQQLILIYVLYLSWIIKIYV